MDRFSRPGDPEGRHWPQRLLVSSDEQLVDLVLGGDDLAFDLLFERHVADALWFAREALGSPEDAEEAVSHSFAAAHAYLAARDRAVEFGPWLQTILGNHCLSMLQARGPRPRRLAKVVDLTEWRSRRGRLGIAAPVASLAGLREGALALFGIGTGAAATGAVGGGGSLVAGTLAKVAVAALLVGGAGAAGDAVSERQRAQSSPAADVVASPQRTAAIVDPALPGTGSLGDGRARARGQERPDGANRRRSDARNGDAPEERVPPSGEREAAAPLLAPGGAAPGVPAAKAPTGAKHPMPAPGETTTAITEPVGTTLGRTQDGAAKPLEPAAPTPALPESLAPIGETVAGIGDHLGVTVEPLVEEVVALPPGEPAATAP